MPAIMDQIQSCVSAIRQATSFVPESAVVLGSGLGGFAEKLQVEAQVPYACRGSRCPQWRGMRGGFFLAMWIKNRLR